MLHTSEEQVIVDGVGVIVGRFQVAELTLGHRELFDSVIARHRKVICVVGLSELRATKNNPLNWEMRRKMISEEYPEVQVVYNNDHPYDEVWSKNLDKIISKNVPPGTQVTLYGSRDSFIKHYSGSYKTKAFLENQVVSGTNERKAIALMEGNSKEFRAGVIWATQNQFDKVYPTVDIVFARKEEGKTKILLGRKEQEKHYRVVGGFSEAEKEYKMGFYERNAMREGTEETGNGSMAFGSWKDLTYLGSCQIDDWRYRNEKDKIATILFGAIYQWGRPEPTDDIHELRWFDLEYLEANYKNMIMYGHVVLLEKVITWAKTL